MKSKGFTLIELLVVVAVVSLLISMLLPALGAARRRARDAKCASNLREVGRGWHMYADDYRDASVPMRFAGAPGGMSNPANWYEVGNGLKFRPRWIATMGLYAGLFAFDEPRTDSERQDYDGAVYQCPEVPEWRDERNHAYGYNYQFLGNSRRTNNRFHNFPVNRTRITMAGDTVLGADSLGTAAGFATQARRDYNARGTGFDELGNHAYSLDPPRLTATSDRGTGDPGTTRTAVDPRHSGKSNVLFCDGHVQPYVPEKLGYRYLSDGRCVDQEKMGADAPYNRFFSGTGEDLDPPALPLP